jgi:hypothetical protein
MSRSTHLAGQPEPDRPQHGARLSSLMVVCQGGMAGFVFYPAATTPGLWPPMSIVARCFLGFHGQVLPGNSNCGGAMRREWCAPHQMNTKGKKLNPKICPSLPQFQTCHGSRRETCGPQPAADAGKLIKMTNAIATATLTPEFLFLGFVFSQLLRLLLHTRCLNAISLRGDAVLAISPCPAFISGLKCSTYFFHGL